MIECGSRHVWLAGCIALAAGCAHQSAAPATTDTLAASFAQADAQRAKQTAPDLYARAERAAHDAREARDEDARSDHATRARLLLDAAIAEADRIDAERAATAADVRAEQAELQRADLERQRLEIEQAIKRELAGAAAREEATRVFQQAASDEQARGRGGAADATRDQAAKFVRDRATLTLAAAIALGLDPAAGDKVSATITAAERAASPPARMAAAERALQDAERALGAARRARGGPTREETASLIALATEHGLAPQPLPRGISIDVGSAFSDSSATPSSAGKRVLDALADVARAHPHGPIQIEALGALGMSKSAQRLAQARAERVRAVLAAATDPARLQLLPAIADSANSIHAQVVFAAYALAMEGSP